MNLLNVFNRIVENGGATYNLSTGEFNPNSGYGVALKGFERAFRILPKLQGLFGAN